MLLFSCVHLRFIYLHVSTFFRNVCTLSSAYIFIVSALLLFLSSLYVQLFLEDRDRGLPH